MADCSANDPGTQFPMGNPGLGPTATTRLFRPQESSAGQVRHGSPEPYHPGPTATSSDEAVAIDGAACEWTVAAREEASAWAHLRLAVPRWVICE